MIEIEKNFIVNDLVRSKIEENCAFLSDKEFTDIYFDYADFRLSKKDYWLRKRNKNYELKIPMSLDMDKTDQYQELETEDEIKKELGLSKDVTLTKSLKASGVLALAKISTKRKKYKHGEFSIDLDKMNFGYQTGEVELMVRDKEDMEEATEKIVNFMKSFGLETKNARGKLVEYSYRNNPTYYNFMIEKGIFKN